MSEQTQKTNTKQSTEEATVETPAVLATTKAKNDKLKQDLDDLLDEIDATLEENAEAFVASYIQKGGQ